MRLGWGSQGGRERRQEGKTKAPTPSGEGAQGEFGISPRPSRPCTYLWRPRPSRPYGRLHYASPAVSRSRHHRRTSLCFVERRCSQRNLYVGEAIPNTKNLREGLAFQFCHIRHFDCPMSAVRLAVAHAASPGIAHDAAAALLRRWRQGRCRARTASSTTTSGASSLQFGSRGISSRLCTPGAASSDCFSAAHARSLLPHNHHQQQQRRHKRAVSAAAASAPSPSLPHISGQQKRRPRGSDGEGEDGVLWTGLPEWRGSPLNRRWVWGKTEAVTLGAEPKHFGRDNEDKLPPGPWVVLDELDHFPVPVPATAPHPHHHQHHRQQFPRDPLPGSLAACADLILRTADPAEKAALSHRVYAHFLHPPDPANPMPIGIALPPSSPARPAKPLLVPPREVPAPKTCEMGRDESTPPTLQLVSLVSMRV